MFIRVAAPGMELSQEQVDGIEEDLAKVDRRLKHFEDVSLEVRVKEGQGSPQSQAVLSLEYGRHHLTAKAVGEDARRAVRIARDELLRQINDRQHGGHDSYQKHR